MMGCLWCVVYNLAFAAAVAASLFLTAALCAVTDADQGVANFVLGAVLFALFFLFFLRGDNFDPDGDGVDSLSGHFRFTCSEAIPHVEHPRGSEWSSGTPRCSSSFSAAASHRHPSCTR
jgi:hypothetical protein